MVLDKRILTKGKRIVRSLKKNKMNKRKRKVRTNSKNLNKRKIRTLAKIQKGGNYKLKLNNVRQSGGGENEVVTINIPSPNDPSITAAQVYFKTCGFDNYLSITEEELNEAFKIKIGSTMPDVDKEKMAKLMSINYLKKKDPELLTDIKTANVDISDYNKMVIKEKPLGFKDREQYISCMNDLMETIDESLREYFSKIEGDNSELITAIDKKTMYKLILTGTSTTFYSENPIKNKDGTKFFDKDRKSDIDIAISFNSEYRDKFINFFSPMQKFESENENLAKQQFSMSDTARILNLYKFYTGDNYDGNGGWGPYDYLGSDKAKDLDNYLQVIGGAPKNIEQKTLIDESKLKREIGVIMLKVEEVPSYNSLCDYRFYYPNDKILEVRQTEQTESPVASAGIEGHGATAAPVEAASAEAASVEAAPDEAVPAVPVAAEPTGPVATETGAAEDTDSEPEGEVVSPVVVQEETERPSATEQQVELETSTNSPFVFIIPVKDSEFKIVLDGYTKDKFHTELLFTNSKANLVSKIREELKKKCKTIKDKYEDVSIDAYINKVLEKVITDKRTILLKIEISSDVINKEYKNPLDDLTSEIDNELYKLTKDQLQNFTPQVSDSAGKSVAPTFELESDRQRSAKGVAEGAVLKENEFRTKHKTYITKEPSLLDSPSIKSDDGRPIIILENTVVTIISSDDVMARTSRGEFEASDTDSAINYLVDRDHEQTGVDKDTLKEKYSNLTIDELHKLVVGENIAFTKIEVIVDGKKYEGWLPREQLTKERNVLNTGGSQTLERSLEGSEELHGTESTEYQQPDTSGFVEDDSDEDQKPYAVAAVEDDDDLFDTEAPIGAPPLSVPKKQTVSETDSPAESVVEEGESPTAAQSAERDPAETTTQAAAPGEGESLTEPATQSADKDLAETTTQPAAPGEGKKPGTLNEFTDFGDFSEIEKLVQTESTYTSADLSLITNTGVPDNHPDMKNQCLWISISDWFKKIHPADQIMTDVKKIKNQYCTVGKCNGSVEMAEIGDRNLNYTDNHGTFNFIAHNQYTREALTNIARKYNILIRIFNRNTLSSLIDLSGMTKDGKSKVPKGEEKEVRTKYDFYDESKGDEIFNDLTKQIWIAYAGNHFQLINTYKYSSKGYNIDYDLSKEHAGGGGEEPEKEKEAEEGEKAEEGEEVSPDIFEIYYDHNSVPFTFNMKKYFDLPKDEVKDPKGESLVTGAIFYYLNKLYDWNGKIYSGKELLKIYTHYIFQKNEKGEDKHSAESALEFRETIQGLLANDFSYDYVANIKDKDTGKLFKEFTYIFEQMEDQFVGDRYKKILKQLNDQGLPSDSSVDPQEGGPAQTKVAEAKPPPAQVDSPLQSPLSTFEVEGASQSNVPTSVVDPAKSVETKPTVEPAKPVGTTSAAVAGESTPSGDVSPGAVATAQDTSKNVSGGPNKGPTSKRKRRKAVLAHEEGIKSDMQSHKGTQQPTEKTTGLDKKNPDLTRAETGGVSVAGAAAGKELGPDQILANRKKRKGEEEAAAAAESTSPGDVALEEVDTEGRTDELGGGGKISTNPDMIGGSLGIIPEQGNDQDIELDESNNRNIKIKLKELVTTINSQIKGGTDDTIVTDTSAFSFIDAQDDPNNDKLTVIIEIETSEDNEKIQQSIKDMEKKIQSILNDQQAKLDNITVYSDGIADNEKTKYVDFVNEGKIFGYQLTNIPGTDLEGERYRSIKEKLQRKRQEKIDKRKKEKQAEIDKELRDHSRLMEQIKELNQKAEKAKQEKLKQLKIQKLAEENKKEHEAAVQLAKQQQQELVKLEGERKKQSDELKLKAEQQAGTVQAAKDKQEAADAVKAAEQALSAAGDDTVAAAKAQEAKDIADQALTDAEKKVDEYNAAEKKIKQELAKVEEEAAAAAEEKQKKEDDEREAAEEARVATEKAVAAAAAAEAAARAEERNRIELEKIDQEILDIERKLKEEQLPLEERQRLEQEAQKKDEDVQKKLADEEQKKREEEEKLKEAEEEAKEAELKAQQARESSQVAALREKDASEAVLTGKLESQAKSDPKIQFSIVEQKFEEFLNSAYKEEKIEYERIRKFPYESLKKIYDALNVKDAITTKLAEKIEIIIAILKTRERHAEEKGEKFSFGVPGDESAEKEATRLRNKDELMLSIKELSVAEKVGESSSQHVNLDDTERDKQLKLQALVSQTSQKKLGFLTEAMGEISEKPEYKEITKDISAAQINVYGNLSNLEKLSAEEKDANYLEMIKDINGKYSEIEDNLNILKTYNRTGLHEIYSMFINEKWKNSIGEDLDQSQKQLVDILICITIISGNYIKKLKTVQKDPNFNRDYHKNIQRSITNITSAIDAIDTKFEFSTDPSKMIKYIYYSFHKDKGLIRYFSLKNGIEVNDDDVYWTEYLSDYAVYLENLMVFILIERLFDNEHLEQYKLRQNIKINEDENKINPSPQLLDKIKEDQKKINRIDSEIPTDIITTTKYGSEKSWDLSIYTEEDSLLSDIKRAHESYLKYTELKKKYVDFYDKYKKDDSLWWSKGEYIGKLRASVFIDDTNYKIPTELEYASYRDVISWIDKEIEKIQMGDGTTTQVWNTIYNSIRFNSNRILIYLLTDPMIQYSEILTNYITNNDKEIIIENMETKYVEIEDGVLDILKNPQERATLLKTKYSNVVGITDIIDFLEFKYGGYMMGSVSSGMKYNDPRQYLFMSVGKEQVKPISTAIMNYNSLGLEYILAVIKREMKQEAEDYKKELEHKLEEKRVYIISLIENSEEELGEELTINSSDFNRYSTIRTFFKGAETEIKTRSKIYEEIKEHSRINDTLNKLNKNIEDETIVNIPEDKRKESNINYKLNWYMTKCVDPNLRKFNASALYLSLLDINCKTQMTLYKNTNLIKDEDRIKNQNTNIKNILDTGAIIHYDVNKGGTTEISEFNIKCNTPLQVVIGSISKNDPRDSAKYKSRIDASTSSLDKGSISLYGTGNLTHLKMLVNHKNFEVDFDPTTTYDYLKTYLTRVIELNKGGDKRTAAEEILNELESKKKFNSKDLLNNLYDKINSSTPEDFKKLFTSETPVYTLNKLFINSCLSKKCIENGIEEGQFIGDDVSDKNQYLHEYLLFYALNLYKNALESYVTSKSTRDKYLKIIEILLEEGASPLILNSDGYTPITFAIKEELLEPLTKFYDKNLIPIPETVTNQDTYKNNIIKERLTSDKSILYLDYDIIDLKNIYYNNFEKKPPADITKERLKKAILDRVAGYDQIDITPLYYSKKCESHNDIQLFLLNKFKETLKENREIIIYSKTTDEELKNWVEDRKTLIDAIKKGPLNFKKDLGVTKGNNGKEISSAEISLSFSGQEKTIKLPYRYIDFPIKKKSGQAAHSGGGTRTIKKPIKNKHKNKNKSQTLSKKEVVNQNKINKKRNKPIQRSIQKPIQRSIQKSIQRSIQKPIQKPIQRSIQKPIRRSIQKPIRRSIHRSNNRIRTLRK